MPCFCYVLFVGLLLNLLIHHFLETKETEVGSVLNRHNILCAHLVSSVGNIIFGKGGCNKVNLTVL